MDTISAELEKEYNKAPLAGIITEIEARVGRHDKGRFVPNSADLHEFDYFIRRLREKFGEEKVSHSLRISLENKGKKQPSYRAIIEDNTSDQSILRMFCRDDKLPSCSIFQVKKERKTIDIPKVLKTALGESGNKDLRISFADEETPDRAIIEEMKSVIQDNGKPGYVSSMFKQMKYYRYMKRFTFKVEGNIEISCSIVKSASGMYFRSAKVLEQDVRYEKELEFKNYNGDSVVGIFNSPHLATFLELFQSGEVTPFEELVSLEKKIREIAPPLGKPPNISVLDAPLTMEQRETNIGNAAIKSAPTAPPVESWCFLDKSDGERGYLVYFNGGLYRLSYVENTTYIHPLGKIEGKGPSDITVYDCEFLDEEHIVLIFDILIKNGKDIRGLPYYRTGYEPSRHREMQYIVESNEITDYEVKLVDLLGRVAELLVSKDSAKAKEAKSIYDYLLASLSYLHNVHYTKYKTSKYTCFAKKARPLLSKKGKETSNIFMDLVQGKSINPLGPATEDQQNKSAIKDHTKTAEISFNFSDMIATLATKKLRGTISDEEANLRIASIIAEAERIATSATPATPATAKTPVTPATAKTPKQSIDFGELVDDGVSISYNIDGIVFQPFNTKYPNTSTWTEVKKWKPTGKITNDFKLVIASEEVYHSARTPLQSLLSHGTPLFRKFKLMHRYGEFKGNSNFYALFKDGANQLWTLTPGPETKDDRIEQIGEKFLDGDIVEFSWNKDHEIWIPVKVRVDKKFPNSELTVNSNWNLIKANITLEMLYNGESSYFPSARPQRSPIVDLHNSIKQHLINISISSISPTKPKEWRVLDLACGRGNDITKWFKTANSNRGTNFTVVGIDNDTENIKTAKETLAKLAKKTPSNLSFQFYVGNCIAPFSKQPALASLGEFDGCVCFFAFHYFLGSDAEHNIFIDNLSRSLRKGAKLTGTCFNGNDVINLFVAANPASKIESFDGSWSLEKGSGYNNVGRITGRAIDVYTARLGRHTEFLVTFATDASVDGLEQLPEVVSTTGPMEDYYREKGFIFKKEDDFETLAKRAEVLAQLASESTKPLSPDELKFSKLNTSFTITKF